MILQANTQGLTGSARRNYIEAGRAITTPVAVVAKPTTPSPATSTIQRSLSSGGSTKAPATIQSATTSGKVTATPAASSINSGISTKTVLSPQTTLTPSSPEAKKTGKQLIAETNQLGLK